MDYPACVEGIIPLIADHGRRKTSAFCNKISAAPLGYCAALAEPAQHPVRVEADGAIGQTYRCQLTAPPAALNRLHHAGVNGIEKD